MSMYWSCKYCGENSGAGKNTCSNSKHTANAIVCNQISFDAERSHFYLPEQRWILEWHAELLATEVGLPKDYFLKQLTEYLQPTAGPSPLTIKQCIVNFFRNMSMYKWCIQ